MENKKRKSSKLLEETWKRTPKKVKQKSNKTITQGEKVLKEVDVSFYSSDRFPRKIKETKIIIGDYKPIFEYLYGEIKGFQTTTIYLNEFESLNAGKILFNNIVEIYLHIILFELKMQKIVITTCEEGTAIFYTKKLNLNNVIDLKNVNCAAIPILYYEHFTVFIINKTLKEIYFIDPLGEKSATQNNNNFKILE